MIVETAHLFANDIHNISIAATWLRQGALVIFPTDTVYGVGCDAFNQTAILRLYAAKKRPLHKAIPILLADLADIDKVAKGIPPLAQTYIERFWPGPLTLLVPKRDDLPAALSLNDKVAIRVPACDVARQLIRAVGGAVATSSANESGQAPALTGEMALATLDGMVAAVLDNGPSPNQIASTVLDCTGAYPHILRYGPVTATDLGL